MVRSFQILSQARDASFPCPGGTPRIALSMNGPKRGWCRLPILSTTWRNVRLAAFLPFGSALVGCNHERIQD